MAFGTLTDVCDALVAALAAEAWSVPFSAARKYRPEFTLEELADIQAAVCAERVSKLRVARNTWQEDAVVTVGMQKRVSAVGDQQEADCDELVRVWDEVCEFLQANDLTLVPGAKLVAMDVVHADRQHLNEQHVWTGAATLTYRGFRTQ